MPTAFDNDQRSPRKLLRSVVARLFGRKRLVWFVAIVVCASVIPAASAAAGDLDTTFSEDGKTTTGPTQYWSSSRAQGVAVQGDGKIVAVGWAATAASTWRFATVRYLLDGTLDPSFSGNGRATARFAGDYAQAFAVAIQADGKIVVAGRARKTSRAKAGKFAVVRYRTDGTLDPTFGGDGKVATDLTPGRVDAAYAVTIQADGKIVAVGSTRAYNTGSVALARYRTDGSLDPSFSRDGKAFVKIGRYNGYGASGVAIQTDQKIVIAGSAVDETGDPLGYQFVLARFNRRGALDPTFSRDGKVTTEFGTPAQTEWAGGVAIQPDGKIVAAGGSTDGRFVLARYNIDGTLDAEFDGNGKVSTPSGGYAANDVAIQGDGKILAAGAVVAGGEDFGDFALARYESDGSLDSTFGVNGIVSTNFVGGPYTEDIARALAVEPDGTIVLAGLAFGGTTYEFGVARYLSE